MAHHVPKSVCDMSSQAPMGGNTSSATELSRKTVPSATEISSGRALTTGATAAMALPPQMAVPEATRCDVRRSIPSIRPSTKPRISTTAMLKTVSRKPSRPAWSAECMFMPKPRPTTAAFSSQPVALLLHEANGLPSRKAMAMPRHRATGVLTSGVAHRTASATKTHLTSVGFGFLMIVVAIISFVFGLIVPFVTLANLRNIHNQNK